jgi:hypothetical protein
MIKNITYALIHSPLVGPLTWQLVQHELEQRGLEAITPVLSDHPNSAQAFWQQHAASFAQSLTGLPPDRSIVLVAHSGAGPLLPVLRQWAAHPVIAYVFLDAGIPRNDSSRLDLMRLQEPHQAELLHQALLQGEQFPTWTEQDLQEVIPDDSLRRKMVAEIHPRSLSFFTERIPVFPLWPDAPCAYIKFSAPYNWDFAQARQAGWPVYEVNAGHFHMLVDPLLVTNMIEAAVRKLGHPKMH